MQDIVPILPELKDVVNDHVERKIREQVEQKWKDYKITANLKEKRFKEPIAEWKRKKVFT
jgi:hypothetical protein